MKQRIIRIIYGFGFLALSMALITPATASAVILDDENRISVVLKDGTAVVLYGEATSTPGLKSKKYHYLPVNLRLADRPDGVPEFLFMKFIAEERAEQGGVSGALMHFLMTWGLTKTQQEELETILKENHGNAQLMGAVQMSPEEESGSFQIISATLSDKGMTPSLITSGKAPLLEGGKAATAARFDKNGAQLLAATFERTRSVTDLSVAMNFSYTTQAPAAKGRVIMDWSQLERIEDKLEANYQKWKSGKKTTKFLGIPISSSPTYSYSYDEMRSHFQSLIENKIVTLQFDEIIADERVAKIREAFFEYFLNAFAESADPEGGVPPAPSEDEKKQMPDIKYGNSYHYKQTFISRSFKKKRQEFNLNYRMAIRRPFQLVGNMMSWYDAAKNYKQCVASVNLNDPFFQHRDIRFILDLDANDMFKDLINYVTINVRKLRSTGRPFEDRITMDAGYIDKNGITASVTYARGEDRNPEAYEYKSQWSLRGGHVYPEKPLWEKGSWEGVTLSPPVVPRTIEVEGDLDAMSSSGITRVTIQIHYPQFGEEMEENIHLSPAKKEPLVSKRIYVDKGTRGYAYRLVINHKTEGKMALPWSPQVGDDYIYAAIPENLLVEDELKTEAKEAARDIVSSAKEKVLDQFKDLFKGDQP